MLGEPPRTQPGTGRRRGQRPARRLCWWFVACGTHLGFRVEFVHREASALKPVTVFILLPILIILRRIMILIAGLITCIKGTVAAAGYSLACRCDLEMKVKFELSWPMMPDERMVSGYRPFGFGVLGFLRLRIFCFELLLPPSDYYRLRV